MDLIIHYSVERGFEDEALSLARRLYAHFDEAIDSLALIPVNGEDLDLFLDGQLVCSLSQSGRTPRVADVRQRVGEGVVDM
jgi:predicted Rdx family selenoprotein